ncbi:MAG TPA: 5'-3' exonuclease H3TH domain-containing protein, partial [Blastocatellia bacterium]
MAPPKKKRLFLIDGMSQIYRAYYAIRGLSTSKGLPTNAIYGFTMMLRKLLSTESPDYIGVIMDSAGPTFRHEAFEKYKSTRTAMPDDLKMQMPYITKVCEVLRIPVASRASFEADDVIGTLTKQAEQLGVDVVIVTNDKDLCQLVNECVTVLRTDRQGNSVMMDSRAVQDKLGVRPDQVVDLLGLMGDSIDDIPGAPGVGEKGAKQLIEQFGSIEDALANADQIARKTYRESLKNNAGLIRQSKELATIKCDVPLDFDLETF